MASVVNEQSLAHVTLNTGHMRWSPRTEVQEHVVQQLVPHIYEALERWAPIPGLATDYTMKALTAGKSLMATVRVNEMPILTFTVTPNREEADRLWEMLRSDDTRIARKKPPWGGKRGPWCLVLLHPTVSLVHKDLLQALADYERCVAWAWLSAP